jgi:hypothetical protein
LKLQAFYSGLFLAWTKAMQVVSHFSPLVAPARSAASLKPQAEAVAVQPLKVEVEKSSGIWETGSFSFRDIIDAINPLQHIPIVSTLYRKLTGDEMGYASRIAGDALYSGIFGSLISGLASAVANVFIDATTGKDIGEHVMAAAEPQPVSPETRQQAAMPQPAREQNSAMLSESLRQQAMPPDQAVMLPAADSPRVQAAIDQYKWQMLDDEVKPRSNYWA